MRHEELLRLRRRLGIDWRDRYGRRSYGITPEQEAAMRHDARIRPPDVRDFKDCRHLSGRRV